MRITATPGLVRIVSGMIIWAVWFVVAYALTGLGCRAGWHLAGSGGANLLTVMLVASAVLALALIARCGWQGHAIWRKAGLESSRGQDATQRLRFIGMATAVLAGIAAIGTLFSVIPMLMLDPCAI